jgi:hypothetical protein
MEAGAPGKILGFHFFRVWFGTELPLVFQVSYNKTQKQTNFKNS